MASKEHQAKVDLLNERIKAAVKARDEDLSFEDQARFCLLHISLVLEREDLDDSARDREALKAVINGKEYPVERRPYDEVFAVQFPSGTIKVVDSNIERLIYPDEESEEETTS